MSRTSRSRISRRSLAWILGSLFFLFAGLSAWQFAMAGEETVDRKLAAEPADYRKEHYQAATPASLRGAQVVSTKEAHRLWASKAAIFIDAMPRPPKPKNLPPNTIWRDTPRYDIPGSVWLVDIGYGALSAERDRYFRDHLEALTGGDRTRAILFYCKAACWMSWNAAKRAIEEYGYKNVIWFPEGTDGWEAAGFELVEAQPAP